MKRISKLVKDLIELQRSYSFVRRAMITEERYKIIVESKLLKKFTYDSEVIREPLIEHVGHVPIVASYLHPEIEHSKKVNLGKTLCMLAVHDIGETATGDVLTYAKTKDHETLEFAQAKKILPKSLFSYFKEFEERKTLEAKFAKSVDSLAPILHELIMPELTLARFKHLDFNIEKIVDKKQQIFEWDEVLKKVFAYVISEYKKM